MLRDMEYLVQLQEIDTRILEQEQAKKQLPSTVQELTAAVEKAERAQESAQKKLADAQQELKTFDEQIVQAQTGLEKSQERLNSIKTNREYDAVHAEIESQKSIIHSSETRKTKLQEEIDRQKQAAEEATAELEKIKGENEPKIAELSATIASIDSVIAGIMEERNKVTPLIKKSIMRTYDLIRDRRNHGKVISVVNQARTCTVCYKVLEPHIVSEIRRGTKIVLCQNCGSIFIWAENLQEAK